MMKLPKRYATPPSRGAGLHQSARPIDQSASALLHSVCNSACTVEGRIATRTASVHERAARISIARRAGHACSSSCTSGTTTFRGVTADASCTSGGISVRLRCVCNSACDGRVAAPVYMPMQLNTIRAETIAASRPALAQCAATVEVEVRGPPVPLSDCCVQSTQIAAWLLPT